LEHNKKKGYYSVKTDEVVACPLCGGLLCYRDSVFRKLKNLASEIRLFLLRRLLCQVCGKLHRELPNIIYPYKHYEADVIQAIIEEREEASSCGADNATIRRWKTDFVAAEPEIKQRLSSVYVRMIDKTVPFTESEDILAKIRTHEKRWLAFVISLLTNSGHKICTEFAFFPSVKSAKVSTAINIIAERGRQNVKTIKDTS
jgi:hypothetical protein